MERSTLLQAVSCADDYDPDSMPVEKAREWIRAFLVPVSGRERVHVRAAFGRVLAEDIVSPINVPGHDNSAMDGYAIRFDDTVGAMPAVLRVIGESFAGRPFCGRVGAGECVRIMTGGVMPEGADTVVMQERVEPVEGGIRISSDVKRGQNVRAAGEDLKAGQVVFRAGQPVRAAELGMVASLGIGEVGVYRRLRAAFFSTGDELRSIGTPLGPGQLYDSNRYTLHGMLTHLGVETLDMGVVEDDPQALESALTEAARMADVIITSGGVSVGEADYTKALLSRLGEVLFWKIAMKPGRPLAYGKIGSTHFFGLPGNPVSVMVTFYQFVREALLILMGRTGAAPLPALKATCITPLKKAPGRTEFQRGILSRDAKGEWTVRATSEQGSGILRSMSEANCFIVLPESQGNVAAGSVVDVQVMEGFV